MKLFDRSGWSCIRVWSLACRDVKNRLSLVRPLRVVEAVIVADIPYSNVLDIFLSRETNNKERLLLFSSSSLGWVKCVIRWFQRQKVPIWRIKSQRRSSLLASSFNSLQLFPSPPYNRTGKNGYPARYKIRRRRPALLIRSFLLLATVLFKSICHFATVLLKSI